MARLVDIHIHVTDHDYGDLLPTVKTYIGTVDAALVSVAVDLETSERSVLLSREFPGRVIPFVGVHPQMARDADMDRFVRFLDRVGDGFVGVGEIGLDRKLGSDHDVGEVQREVFKMQLVEAEKRGRPVSVHSRGTLQEIMEILPSYRLNGVLLHWFAGSEEDLGEAVSRGYYASFGPALVYSKGKRRLAASMPPEYILTETDGPVRYGACFGGRLAVPAFLPSVLFALTSVIGRPYDDTLSLIHRNSERYLGIGL
jgi:TatD DNase family protein